MVTEIREVIGDRARKTGIIRTVHGYGYAFGAKVVDVEPNRAVADDGDPRCWIIWRKRAFPLTEGEHICAGQARGG